jgi:hypothetical protein
METDACSRPRVEERGREIETAERVSEWWHVGFFAWLTTPERRLSTRTLQTAVLTPP